MNHQFQYASSKTLFQVQTMHVYVPFPLPLGPRTIQNISYDTKIVKFSLETTDATL